MADFFKYALTNFKIVLKDGRSYVIHARKNGYINATKLCRAGGKEFTTWKKTKKADEYFEAGEKFYEIPRAELVVNVSTGPLEQRGIYVHRCIIIPISIWINMHFYMQVFDWVELLFVDQRRRNLFFDIKMDELMKTNALLTKSEKMLHINLGNIADTYSEIRKNKDNMSDEKYKSLTDLIFSKRDKCIEYIKKSESMLLFEKVKKKLLDRIKYGHIEDYKRL